MDVADLPERFQTKIEINPETGCWIWTAAKDRLGYGRVNMGRVLGAKFAHRVIFRLLKAEPDPFDLDHLCRVPSCVNPDHLEAVTHAVNIQRGNTSRVTKALYAAPRDCPQGHPLSGSNLYAHVTKAGYVNRQCRTCRADSKRRRRATGAA